MNENEKHFKIDEKKESRQSCKIKRKKKANGGVAVLCRRVAVC